jgi:putative ABC transport system permease protein
MRRALRLLHLRRLYSVHLRTIIAVVAVAAGSSLALSVVLVEQSASYSLNRLTEQVAGSSELKVVGATSTAGITFRALADVWRTPGVGGVIPLVQAITVVRTTGSHNQGVLAIGVSCSDLAVVAQASCPDAGAGAGAGGSDGGAQAFISSTLAHRLAPSSWLETDQGTEPLADATALASLNGVDHGDVVVLPLSQAQRAFNRAGRLDALYVTPANGVSTGVLQARLARAVGPWDGVVGAATPPPAVSLALEGFTPLLTLLAILASGIAVVLVYNVITLTLEERRLERAISAAVGAPPSVLVLGPLLEAAVLGAIGGMVGAVGGVILAGPIVGTLSHITEQLAGIPITVHASTATFVTGVVIGVVIGVVAAIRPVRQSLRADVAAEISGREQRDRTSAPTTIRRALLYSSLVVVGAALCWAGTRNGALEGWQPAAAFGGFILAMLFTSFTLGAWAPVVIGGLARRGPRGGVTRLGIANLVREPGRTSVMAVAIGATVITAFITSSFDRAITQDIAASYAHSSRAGSVLVSTVASGGGSNADGQIPPADLAALSRLAGVRGIDRFYGELTGHSAGQLTLVESESVPSVRGVTVYAGTATLADFEKGQVLVGPNLARRDHLRHGSDLTLDTPTGLARVTVQGVWNDGDAAGDNVYLPVALQQQLFGPSDPPAAALLLAPGSIPAGVAAEARAAHLGPYLKFATPAAQLRASDANATSQLTPFLVLQRALLLVAFISVLSTLLLAGLQRRREFGLLGAVGMTPKELFRMVMAEAFTVAVVAVILAGVVGFLLLSVLLNVMPLLIGYHDTYAPDLASLLVYGPVAVAVAILGSLWPGRLAARTPILEALKYE